MQKVLLQTWSASLKYVHVHVAISNKVLELKVDRGLFARNAANSRPDMHFKECLSNYELSIVPRLLFTADETMLYCSAKSKLMDILEKMSSAETSDITPPDILQQNKCVKIIHTMDDVQSMENLAGLRRAKICQLISLHLYKENMMNYIILFDRYDIPKSLNSATRHLWHITAQTLQNFKCSTEESVIPHSKKDELTVFLS